MTEKFFTGTLRINQPTNINTYHSFNKNGLTIAVKKYRNQFFLQRLSKTFTQALRLASLFRLSKCKDIRSRMKACLNLLYDSMLSKLEL